MGSEEQLKAKASSTSAAAAINDDVLKAGVVAGLLSSSCCLLQLMLNALSWFNVIHLGCAGFNKILGPPRPYFRGLTFGWLAVCWYKTSNSKQGRGRMLRATVVSLLLMFLPEMLQVWDHSHPILRRSLTKSIDMEDLMEKKFLVHNMGCEACQGAVRNLLEESPEVEMAQVNWESGQVSVFGKSIDALDVAAVADLLDMHGYELDTTSDPNNPITF